MAATRAAQLGELPLVRIGQHDAVLRLHDVDARRASSAGRAGSAIASSRGARAQDVVTVRVQPLRDVAGRCSAAAAPSPGGVGSLPPWTASLPIWARAGTRAGRARRGPRGRRPRRGRAPRPRAPTPCRSRNAAASSPAVRRVDGEGRGVDLHARGDAQDRDAAGRRRRRMSRAVPSPPANRSRSTPASRHRAGDPPRVLGRGRAPGATSPTVTAARPAARAACCAHPGRRGDELHVRGAAGRGPARARRAERLPPARRPSSQCAALDVGPVAPLQADPARRCRRPGSTMQARSARLGAARASHPPARTGAAGRGVHVLRLISAPRRGPRSRRPRGRARSTWWTVLPCGAARHPLRVRRRPPRRSVPRIAAYSSRSACE